MIRSIDVFPKGDFKARVQTGDSYAALRLCAGPVSSDCEINLFGRPEDVNLFNAIAKLLNEVFASEKVEAGE